MNKHYKHIGIGKEAFELNINPASVVGAIVGTLTAREAAKMEATEQIKQIMSPKPVTASYYKNVQNFSDNTIIRFTPLGVLYTVKNGTSDLTVDQIGLDEMSPEVRSHFDMRDTAYFKNIMLNKMRSDIQLTETILAKRLIDRSMDVGLGKEANDDLANLNLVKYAADMMPTSSLVDYILDDGEFIITASFGSLKEGLLKYAGVFGKELSFPNIAEIGKAKDDKLENLEDPKYVSQNAQVLFLPDRVMFVVDGTVLGQLSTLDMNEEGFKAFERNDRQYFLNFFSHTLGVKRNAILDFLKNASEVTTVDGLFKMPLVHPSLYYELLTKQYGAAWLDFDPEILLKAVETDFTLGDAVNPLVANKLMMIQAANNPDGIVFKNIFAFEKMIRAFNGDPIDFMDVEDDISLGEFVFALRVAEEVTPLDDIYDNLSTGAIDYMEDALMSQNILLIDIVAKSENEALLFNKHLDLQVRSDIFEFKYGDDPELVQLKEQSRLKLVISTARSILKEVRANGGAEAMVPILNETLLRIKTSLTAMSEDYFIEFSALVTRCVEQNMAVDVYLAFMEDQKSSLLQSVLKPEVK